MWHLRTIWLDKIGAPAARFLDEKVELSDEFGVPLDTIVWLRNGGGKSTVLSLLCAQLRPKRGDFLASSTTGKYIQDYVASGDTSHTMLEWVNDQGDRLITGAVYEWENLTAPENVETNHDKLKQAWYCLTPPPEMALADLPRHDDVGKPLRLNEFTAAVRALPATHDSIVCTRQQRWWQTLEDRHMDPALLTPILTMNATEGGIDAAFSFVKPDGFIRYLLSLVADPEPVAAVASTLEKVRLQLANRPRTQTDLTFAQEGVPRLRDLGVAHGAHERARADLKQAQTEAAALAAAFRSRRTLSEAQAEIDQADSDSVRELGRAARSARDLATDRAAELRRLAAQHRRDGAVAANELAEKDSAGAVAHLAAVNGLDRLVNQQAQTERVRTLTEQLASLERGAAPLAKDRDDAAVVLAVVLTNTLGELAQQAGVRTDKVFAAQARAERAGQQQRDAAGELGELKGAARSHRQVVESYDAALGAARRKDQLGDDQEPAAAYDALVATDCADADRTAVLLETATTSAAQLETTRTALGTARTTTADRNRDLRDALDAQRALTVAVAQLAADPDVRDLAQDDNVDVLAEARMLASLAGARVERLDAKRMGQAVSTAGARRALAELDHSQLLPPDVDLERALAELTDAGIAATSGWRYLADNVPVAQHTQVFARLPALVAGVAVHDVEQLELARQTLTSAQLRPSTAIAVGTTAQLHAAATDDGERTWTIPPAWALADRTLAAQESELRSLEVSEADRADQELSNRRARIARLAAALTDLATRYAPTDRKRLDDAVTNAEAAVAAAVGTVKQLERDAQERQSALEKVQQEQRDVGGRRLTTAKSLEQLRQLVEHSVPAAQARAALEAIPGRADAQQALLDSGAAAASAANDELKTLGLEDQDAQRTARELTAERDQLPTATPEAADLPLPSLANARMTHEQAAQAYALATSGSPLAGVLEEARTTLKRYTDALKVLPAAVREAAQELLDGGADPAELPELAAAAGSNLERRRSALVDAATELKITRAELASLTPSDRARHRILDGPEPATRELALAAALTEDANREKALAEENAATIRVTALTESIGRHLQLAKDLTTLLTALPAAAGEPDLEAPPSAAFVGIGEQAAELAAERRGAYDLAATVANTAELAFQRVARELFGWATSDRFAGVTEQMRSRFRSPDLATQLAPDADQLADTLSEAATSLSAHLEELEGHQRTAVTAMRGMVRAALSTLRRLEAASRLPDTLPAWGGHKFLSVGPRSKVDLSDAVVDDRIGRVVDALCLAGSEIPSGQELLWTATHAVVGDGNWMAKVLKPTVDGTAQMSTVAEMRKWSGGEKVTANLLLFALAARVRAQERGRDHVGFGVLPLDNPLGKASYVPFLELQRKVAAEYGIQLLFLTGVADLKAVGRFPNIVRMANRASAGRGYVTVMGREVEQSPVRHVTHVRLHRPDPIPGL